MFFYTKIYLHGDVLKQKKINIVGDPKLLNNNSYYPLCFSYVVLFVLANTKGL